MGIVNGAPIGVGPCITLYERSECGGKRLSSRPVESVSKVLRTLVQLPSSIGQGTDCHLICISEQLIPSCKMEMITVGASPGVFCSPNLHTTLKISNFAM